MASDLYCPSCGEYLGKDSECSNLAYCSQCGTDNIKNPHGITKEQEEKENKEWIRKIQEKY